MALANSNLLLNLTHDLLDYAQIQEGRLKINISKMKLKEIIDGVFNLMEITANLKKINLKQDLKVRNYNSIEIFTDERRLKQVY